MDTILIILMKYEYKHILTYVTSMENACKNPKLCYQAIVACYLPSTLGIICSVTDVAILHSFSEEHIVGYELQWFDDSDD